MERETFQLEDLFVDLMELTVSRNDGERLEISMPGDLDAFSVRQYIRIDRVNYDDEPPWPAEPDGTGPSLTRIRPLDYGNDVANWAAVSPTPAS